MNDHCRLMACLNPTPKYREDGEEDFHAGHCLGARWPTHEHTYIQTDKQAKVSRVTGDVLLPTP